ncbi:transposase [Streptomyces sp. CWNU-1]|uniref:Transposase n=1 Tax=Streptomyces albipurpureus TaxID=2897419 RepID=A0ABT0V0W4_9ACTN|nr:transposase [Streptomyces sp. CWNU-1]MCM2393041.1 transposase [Streptomyces sp. CWNU-1]
MITERAAEQWDLGLDDLFVTIGHRFRRVELRRRLREYVRGLLAPVARKNSWQLAERAGHSTPDGPQHLLAGAKWEADDIRDDLQEYVATKLGEEGGALIIDDTGFVGSADHDVRGFGVTVDHGLFAAVLQRVKDVGRDGYRLFDGQPCVVCDLIERQTFSVLHDDEGNAGLLGGALFHVVEDRYARVAELGRRAGLPPETGGELGVLEKFGREGLHRDLAPEFAVQGPVHHPHPALPQSPLHFIPPRQHPHSVVSPLRRPLRTGGDPADATVCGSRSPRVRTSTENGVRSGRRIRSRPSGASRPAAVVAARRSRPSWPAGVTATTCFRRARGAGRVAVTPNPVSRRDGWPHRRPARNRNRLEPTAVRQSTFTSVATGVPGEGRI